MHSPFEKKFPPHSTCVLTSEGQSVLNYTQTKACVFVFLHLITCRVLWGVKYGKLVRTSAWQSADHRCIFNWRLLFSRLDSPYWAYEVPRPHSDTPQSVALLWISYRPVVETFTWHHTILTTNTHAPRGIRTRNHSKRTDADQRLRRRATEAG